MRVAFSTLSRLSIQNINASLKKVVEYRQMVATGRAFSTSSEDPIGAGKSVFLSKQAAMYDQLRSSADSALFFLEVAASDLLDVGEQLREAKTIALSQMNATSDAGSRAAAAIEVREIREQVMLLLNHQVQGRYLFAGHLTKTKPFVDSVRGVEYHGDSGEIHFRIGPDQLEVTNIPGDQLFEFGSPRMESTVDLSPNVSGNTLFSVLNGGQGISSGSFEIEDAAGNVLTISTAGLTTVQGLMNRINTVPKLIGVTAQINGQGNGILLVADNPGDQIIVRDVGGGTVAADLNLRGTGIGTIDSGDLDPVLDVTTRIADIPVIPAGTLGSIRVYLDGVPVTVDFGALPPVTTIGELIDRFNQSVPQLTMTLNAGLTGFEITGIVSFDITTDGADMTAAWLGLVGSGHGARLFGCLEDLEQALLDDDDTRIEAMIREMEDVIRNFTGIQGVAASRLERIQSAIDLIDRHRVDVEERLSDIQDVDIAAAITRLSEAEILYEAALGTAARIYDLSLLNYL